MLIKWTKYYDKLSKLLDRYDPNRSFNLQGQVKSKFEELSRKAKRSFIVGLLGVTTIRRARRWVEIFKSSINECARNLNAKSVVLSKELKSFIEDPELHLEKKLFMYFYDLLRGRISLEEYEEKGRAAITTSLMTNLRTIYQNWVLSTLWSILAEEHGAEVLYPEHKCLHLERLGKQKLGEINPNLVLHVSGKGSLSFFLEAPRPVGWEDTSDLMKAWKLYTALRPDIMVHGGMIVNLIDPTQNPPIKPPDIIIECKELADWYIRSRDVKGPLAKPLTVEEWRSKWIKGLYEGLADILGVPPSRAAEKVSEQKGLRLREDRVVVLYKTFYKPKKMFLITRAKTPSIVKKHLESEGITIFDGIGFNKQELRPIAKELAEIARPSTKLEELSSRLLQEAKKIGVKLTPNKLIELTLRYAEDNLSDFISWMKRARDLE
ncbi:MAG: hypothetical protein ACXQTU_02170 [Candidatus Nezhaarchaeales archaeon]